VSDSDSEGRRFDSCRVRQPIQIVSDLDPRTNPDLCGSFAGVWGITPRNTTNSGVLPFCLATLFVRLRIVGQSARNRARSRWSTGIPIASILATAIMNRPRSSARPTSSDDDIAWKSRATAWRRSRIVVGDREPTSAPEVGCPKCSRAPARPPTRRLGMPFVKFLNSTRRSMSRSGSRQESARWQAISSLASIVTIRACGPVG
jgi:hypothetical protein